MVPEKMLVEGWKALSCTKSVLDISLVLCSGQSFRWKEVDGCWTGVHEKRVWQFKQDENQIWFKVLKNDTVDRFQRVGKKRKSNSKTSQSGGKTPKLECDITTVNDSSSSEKELLEDYFQLGVNLTKHCETWCKIDEHFSSIRKKFSGMRMLRQDPIENLFSFICSSNNNIIRISSMVEKMCATFGEKIYEDEIGQCYYAFPTIDALAQSKTEELLRKLGFGYRAKYIYQSAVQIQKSGGEKWLRDLRVASYEEAHSELTKLSGIGAKVADCVCMMSLDKPQAIPVDTHVWQIATRDYKISSLKSTKTLTAASYKAIGNFFRRLWGSHASWAMNFLFVADLKQFQQRNKQMDP